MSTSMSTAFLNLNFNFQFQGNNWPSELKRKPQRVQVRKRIILFFSCFFFSPQA